MILWSLMNCRQGFQQTVVSRACMMKKIRYITMWTVTENQCSDNTELV